MTWTAEHLNRIKAAHEIDIAAKRADGSLRRWTPVWVVEVDGDVFVRTWYRRKTGWYGAVLRTGQARIRVPGLEVDVRVEDAGCESTEIRPGVDHAYRKKYGDGSTGGMVTDDAAVTTLRLLPR